MPLHFQPQIVAVAAEDKTLTRLLKELNPLISEDPAGDAERAATAAANDAILEQIREGMMRDAKQKVKNDDSDL